MTAFCVICDLPISFDGRGWRHDSDPLRDLEHPPAPDVGLLSVRRENA